jgi:hypothetical protein
MDHEHTAPLRRHRDQVVRASRILPAQASNTSRQPFRAGCSGWGSLSLHVGHAGASSQQPDTETDTDTHTLAQRGNKPREALRIQRRVRRSAIHVIPDCEKIDAIILNCTHPDDWERSWKR